MRELRTPPDGALRRSEGLPGARLRLWLRASEQRRALRPTPLVKLNRRVLL